MATTIHTTEVKGVLEQVGEHRKQTRKLQGVAEQNRRFGRYGRKQNREDDRPTSASYQKR